MKKRRCNKCGRLFMPTNLYDYTCEIYSMEKWLKTIRYPFAYVFFTLDLWFSVISALLIASIWLALFIFSYQIKKQKKEL